MIAPRNSPPSPHPNEEGRTAVSGKSNQSQLARLLKFWVSDRMLLWGEAGFIAGYYVMWNVELQLMWQIALCLPAGIWLWRKTRGNGMSCETTMRLAAAFLTWNIAVGLIRNSDAFSDYYTFEFLAGALLLPVYLGTLWLVCRTTGGSHCLLQTLVWTAFIAAVAGIGWWAFVLHPNDPGARLRNPLVHGGLHPVATAITLGFGGLTAAAMYVRQEKKAIRWKLLGVVAMTCLAVMLTFSRGGILAMAFGYGALLLAAGWRKSWPPVVTATTVAVVFQFFSSALTSAGSVSPRVANGTREQPANLPVQINEYFARGDSGRLYVYRVGLASLDRWDKIITGAGLWGPERNLKTLTNGVIDHLHSLFVATAVHGGIAGTAMLLTLIGLGARRAWTLSRAGQPQWFALLFYGIGGLLFDGQSACSLVTHPRFENLILWFPLVAIAAAWKEDQEGRQPSKSESR